MLIEYYRGKNRTPKAGNSNRHPKGVFVAIPETYPDGKSRILFGWSKCNTKLDKFDRDYGIDIACKRALSDKNLNLEIMPDEMRAHFHNFVQRSLKYYKNKTNTNLPKKWFQTILNVKGFLREVIRSSSFLKNRERFGNDF